MTQTVGVIGLGDMGLAMARNLLAAGFPTFGYDLREERLALLEAAGGTRAENPAHLAQAAETIFVMVLNGSQTRQVVQRRKRPARRVAARRHPDHQRHHRTA